MKKIIIVLILLTAVSCSDDQSPTGKLLVDIDALQKSPTQLKLDSTTSLALEVTLWRDFMPISPEDGKPMFALVKLFTVDSTVLPSNINIDKLWVINDREVWEADLVTVSIDDQIFQITKRASGGPKWEPKIYVEAVVRIVLKDSTKMYLKNENVLIERTE